MNLLKVPDSEIFTILDSRYFYTTTSPLLGDFGAEIKN